MAVPAPSVSEGGRIASPLYVIACRVTGSRDGRLPRRPGHRCCPA